MTSKKSMGVTESERILSEYCERSFLKLWTYPNPYKDDKHELCDLLAVFGNYVFIFFDRDNQIPLTSEKDPKVLWDRWKKNVIDKQINTAHGAERYIKSGRQIYVDGKCTIPFPLNIDRSSMIVHKIIVAHGAKESCLQQSEDNIYGSLGISYSSTSAASSAPSLPFMINLDRDKPVHVFDSHNLPILLNELDTVTDFSLYLDAKVEAINSLSLLSYCGEEDLLAHYLLNINEQNKHFIGVTEKNFTGLMIHEGDWKDFSESDVYLETKNASKVSYAWDEMIQRTCQNSLDGTLRGNADLLRGKSAIFEMVKEPRFIRRTLADTMFKSVEDFPESLGSLARKVTVMPSFHDGTAYVFLQLKVSQTVLGQKDYRSKKQRILEIACGAAKNAFPELKTIVGIAINAPKYHEDCSEDFILMPCEIWTQEIKNHYEQENLNWNFFQTSALIKRKMNVTEFVAPEQKSIISEKQKVGRNVPCPCGSGKKFKKCCGT